MVSIWLQNPVETVAILGATGSGKSSIVDLVPRFYDVASGRVTWNGIDVRQVKQSDLLAEVGVVPQETVLFSGTVRDNIRYGKPEASDESVIAAAKAAQAHDFIMKLPNGYDTRVEEARREFFRWTETTHRDCPGVSAQAFRFDPRRQYQLS